MRPTAASDPFTGIRGAGQYGWPVSPVRSFEMEMALPEGVVERAARGIRETSLYILALTRGEGRDILRRRAPRLDQAAERPATA